MIGEFRIWRSRIVLWLGGAAVLLVLLCAGLWLARASLAKSFLDGWCKRNTITCEANVQKLNLNTVELTSLRIRSAGQVPIEAEGLGLTLHWPGFLKPKIQTVRIDAPVVRGQFADGALSLYDLEAVILAQLEGSNSSDSPTPVPQIDITEGRLEIQTQAGLVTGAFASTGVPFQNGTVSFDIDPATLSEGEARVSWSAGTFGLSFADGETIGGADIMIEQVRLDGLEVDSAELAAEIIDNGTGLTLKATGNAARANFGDVRSEALSFNLNGTAGALSGLTLEALIDAMEQLSLSASTGSLASEAGEIAKIGLNLALQANGDKVSGPLTVEFTDLTSKAGGARELVLDGTIDLTRGTDPEYRYAGAIIADGAKLTADTLNPLLATLDLPEPLTAHSAALKRALKTAAGEFALSSHIEISHSEAGLRLVSARPAELAATSGLRLAITPPETAPWLRYASGQTTIAGQIALGGARGAPNISAQLDEARFGADGLTLSGQQLTLAPWLATERSLALSLKRFTFAPETSEGISGAGSVTISGAFPGLTLEQTRLAGSMHAVKTEAGWQVKPADGQCASLSSQGGAAGTLVFAPISLPLCPVNGFFVTQKGETSVGAIKLGDLSLPFTAGENTGVLSLGNTRGNWLIGDGIQISLTGDTFGLPMQIAERSLDIESQTPQLSLSLADGPLQIVARLGETSFGGDLVPANVVARDFVFDGRSGESGITGQMRSDHVRITDINADPIYRPLIADLTADLINGVFTLQGPIRSETKGQELADANLTLDLATLDGSAKVSLRPLTFAINGLQPVDLSDLLRDILVSARGGMEGGADFVITGGEVTSTGFVQLQDLTFETLRVGTVQGVNGRLNFTDMLALTTAPSQRLTIDLMNPGVPLANGVVDFQIIDATTAGLERARWPFAGGELVLAPVTWLFGSQTPMNVLLEAKELKLEELVDVFKVPDLQAVGTVSGTLPVEIDGANLIVRNAKLEADEAGGYISYQGDAGEAAKDQNAYAEYAFDALQDLYYTVMEIGADGNLIGDIVVTAKLLGKSPDVLGGAEFDFNLRVDSNLFQLLRTTTSQAGQTYIREALELERREKEAAAQENNP